MKKDNLIDLIRNAHDIVSICKDVTDEIYTMVSDIKDINDEKYQDKEIDNLLDKILDLLE